MAPPPTLTIDVVTVTPHRLRFLGHNSGGDLTVTVTNAQLVAAAIEPMKTIIQRAVSSVDDARQLLLGTGTPGNVFKLVSSTQPQRYCRVRVHYRDISQIDSYMAVDAAANMGRADLVFSSRANGDTHWVIDLEVEHSLTQ